MGSNPLPDRESDLADLMRHIVDHHHRYVREISPTINVWLTRLAETHGDRHPELVEIRQTFRDLSEALLTHLVKEENILFPFIDDLATAVRSGASIPSGPFGTLMHPIRVMESDHQAVNHLVDRLRALTDVYQAPPDACTTYRRCYAELARFDEDLHRHVHLENDVLFPRAIALENRQS